MSGGGKGGGGSQTIGYRYFFDIHMGISRGPVNELVEIRVGDKSAWPFPENVENDDKPKPDEFDNNAVVLETSARVSMQTQLMWPNVVIVFYEKFPNRWAPGMFVKIEEFKRYPLDQDDRPLPDLANRSGVFPVVAVQGYDQNLVIQVDPYNTENFVHWETFTRGRATEDMPNYKFTLTDAAGNPVDPFAPPPPDPAADSPVVSDNAVIDIQAGQLFGGDKAEGGIAGKLHVLMGGPTQTAPASLVSMLGYALPGFRRMFTVFYSGLIASMNPYPKAWKFRVRRSTAGWDGPVFAPELATITIRRDPAEVVMTSSALVKGMNGAHILYEVLTNREWGRGLPRSRLNESSFYAVASTLAAEQFALCMRWNRTETIDNFVQSVLDHIGAVIYTDPETALLTLKLIRADYDINALPVFDASNGLLSIEEAPVAGGGTYPNEIRVTYLDPITNKERQTRAHNLGSIQANGGAINSKSITYIGVPSPALAARLAMRDLKTYGMELRTFTFKVDRRGSSIRPGQVVRLRDPSRGINDVAVRVITYGDGTMTNGAITLTGVQDVFGMPALSNVGEQPNGWTPPTTKPCIGVHEVFEVPYVVLARMLRPADLAYVEDDSAYVGVALDQGQPLNAGYQLAIRNGSPTPDDVPTSDGYYCGYVPPTE